jgi:peptide/nickel transport system permease protein
VHNYLIRRILYLIPVMLIVVTFVFFMVHLIPGDPAAVMAGMEASKEDIEQMRRMMGLDRPIYEQYGRYVMRLSRGDLGRSLFLDRPVVAIIAERLEPTLILTVFALVVAVTIGMPAGIIAGRLPNTWSDKATMVIAMLGISMPPFWLGLNLIYIFSLKLKFFPPGNYVSLASNPIKCFYYMLLPSFSLGFASAALVARILRSCMIEVLNQDYIRTARAKGLTERVVVFIHSLRNAMVPTMTVIGITVAIHLGGAVVTETVFNLPGVGRLVMTAISRRDYPVIQGVVLFIAAIYVCVNLVVDLIYCLIDPRIRYD